MAFLLKASCCLALVPFSVTADDHWKELLGCTAIAVDGEASLDGSGFAGMNADSGTGDWRLTFVPPKSNKDGTVRPVYPQQITYPRYVGYGRGAFYHPDQHPGYNMTVPLGYIPEVKSTYGYYESLQPLMNDQGLGLGESSCGAMLLNKAPGDTTDTRDVPVGLLDTASLMELALERCATSRCAVELMGQLAEEHGFGPTPGEVSGFGSCGGRKCWDDAGEAYTVADKTGEVWVFHIVGGVKGIINSVWVAQKVPKGHFAIVANEFIIGELPQEPNDDYLFNPKIRDAAIAAKLWNGTGVLNWKKVFAPESLTFESPAGATPIPLYASLRQWALMNSVAPSLGLKLKVSSQDLPFSVPVDKKLSHRDILDTLRYNYEGTEFDLTQGILAGPLGNPFRFEGGPRGGQIPRGISIQRTMYAIITQSGPSRQLAWFSMDVPSTSVYVPLLPQTGTVARVYAIGKQTEFDRESAGWAFNFVSNLMTWNYRDSSQQDVYPAIKKWQDTIDEQLGNLDMSDIDTLSTWQVSIQEQVVASWWKLADFLIMKYNDGMVNFPSVGISTGYPQSFADMIGFGNDVHPIWVQPAKKPPSSISWVEKNPLPTIWNATSQRWLPAVQSVAMITSAPGDSELGMVAMAASLMLAVAVGVVIGRSYESNRQKTRDAYILLS